MQYVRQAGSDPSFLIKALNEACGELRHSIYGIPRSRLLQPAPAPDEDWCLMGVAFHMRQVEEGFLEQLEAILSSRNAEIPHVDLDDIPFREDYANLDEDEVLAEFQYYRRHSNYVLWDLSANQWDRTGRHPYRGELTITDLAREMYRHDLEHLWQVRRMIERMGTR